MNKNIYSEFTKRNKLSSEISYEQLEEKIEQNAREQEADNIILAEDKRVQ